MQSVKLRAVDLAAEAGEGGASCAAVEAAVAVETAAAEPLDAAGETGDEGGSIRGSIGGKFAI